MSSNENIILTGSPPSSFDRKIAYSDGDEGVAAKWIPNEQTNGCMLCGKAFGVFRRKHHCRSCGGLVCGKCSPEKHYVHGYKDQRVRVCKTCAAIKVKRQLEIND